MDYLDNVLEFPEKIPDERQEKQYLARKLYCSTVFLSTAYTAVKIFLARKDPVKKIFIGKAYYRYWFPFMISGLVIYPIDNYCWNLLNSQVGFWQNSIFIV